MAERRLIMSDDLLLATVKGEKTRTSRIQRTKHPRYYEAGDLAWLAYVWATHKLNDDHGPKEAHEYWNLIPPLWIRAFHGEEDDPDRGKWRTARFLPRTFSQLFCEVLHSKTIRLHELTDEEIEQEGVQYLVDKYGDGNTRNAMLNLADWSSGVTKWKTQAIQRIRREGISHRTLFSVLWDKLNFNRGFGWNTNPVVISVEYKYIPTVKPVGGDLRVDMDIAIPAIENVIKVP